MFGWLKKKNEVNLKEEERDRRMKESQNALMMAALNTANTAQEVTNKLKMRLDDIIIQIQETTRLMSEALIMCNVLGEITTFNPAAESLYGITAEEASKINIIELFGRCNGGEIDDLAQLWSLLSNEDQNDVCGRRGSGYFPIKANTNMLNRHDGSTSVLLFVREELSTQQKKTQAFYETIYENDFDAVMIVRRGHVLAANPASGRLFGYSTYEMLNRHIGVLVHPKDKERFIERCHRFQHDDAPQYFFQDGIHSTGILLELAFCIAVVEWEGEPAILMTTKEVSELKRLEGVLGSHQDHAKLLF